MITTKTTYIGGLRTEAQHLRSGNKIITDAPIDNQGKGEAFSPTDLVATALGSCMITIVGIAANNHHFNIDGTQIEITKVMASDPRRISEVIVDFTFPPNNYTEKQKKIIEVSALTCPVAKSLHPDLKQSVNFKYT